MITTIVFDIGGVFLHQAENLTNKLWNEFGLADPAVGDHAMYGDELWDRYKRGGMTEEDYWKGLINKLPKDFSENWTSLCDWFEHSVELDTELNTIVKKLRKKYQIHALSNAGAELERRLEHFGIADLFGEVINSHHVKMAKPDKEIYQLTAELVGAKPENILFVDDKYRNTRVADELGFKTHVYTNAQSFHAFLIESKIVMEEELTLL
jgi:HAD superfamily hydrolase (TIGR01509 family)